MEKTKFKADPYNPNNLSLSSSRFPSTNSKGGFLDKDNSPWYKSIKLFRQQRRNNWEAVIKTVTRSIDKL